jgi:hypothetical protein
VGGSLGKSVNMESEDDVEVLVLLDSILREDT